MDSISTLKQRCYALHELNCLYTLRQWDWHNTLQSPVAGAQAAYHKLALKVLTYSSDDLTKIPHNLQQGRDG